MQEIRMLSAFTLEEWGDKKLCCVNEGFVLTLSISCQLKGDECDGGDVSRHTVELAATDHCLSLI